MKKKVSSSYSSVTIKPYVKTSHSESITKFNITHVCIVSKTSYQLTFVLKVSGQANLLKNSDFTGIRSKLTYFGS